MGFLRYVVAVIFVTLTPFCFATLCDPITFRQRQISSERHGQLINVGMTTFGPVVAEPAPLAIDAGGNIWVGSFAKRAISKITPNGSVETIATAGPVKNLALGPDSKIYAAEGGCIERIDPSKNETSKVYEYNFAENPNYSSFTLSWDVAGNLYTASSSGQVTKILPNGKAAAFADASAFGGAIVWRSLFAPNGNLIVIFSGDKHFPSAVVSITPSGSVSAYANIAAYKDCIQGAFDSAGNLNVVCGATNNVISISPSGNARVLAQFTGNPALQFFAPDDRGNLYIAAYNWGIITKVTPSGVMSTFATLPSGERPEVPIFDHNFNLYVSGFKLDSVYKIKTRQ